MTVMMTLVVIPEESIRLVKYDALAPFCMRLDWCWNEETGVKKVVETNPQTPSFWFECTVGNQRVAEHFGLRSPDFDAQDTLQFTLNQHVKRAAVFLDKPLEECQVVFTTWVEISEEILKGRCKMHERFSASMSNKFPAAKVILPRYEPAYGAGLLALKSLVGEREN
jgi:hypothetical protein